MNKIYFNNWTKSTSKVFLRNRSFKRKIYYPDCINDLDNVVAQLMKDLKYIITII